MKTVMLVDDSATIRMSVEALLRVAGFRSTAAVNGAEAMGKVSAGLRPDLIISDVNMPVMDGITFVREVRKVAGMRFVPILMLTTESEKLRRDAARAAGATGWLVKPVQSDQLLATIKQVLPGT